MNSSSKQDRFKRDDIYDDTEQDKIVKLQKVQEYLSPQLSENREIINKCLVENTQKKQAKQPTGWNQLSSRSDLQYTVTSSKNFNRESEMTQIPQNFDDQQSHQFNDNSNDHQKFKSKGVQEQEEQVDDKQAHQMTIDALTTCIYSSITKNKMQEMKIQELENIIAQLQQINVQSTNFSHSIPLIASSPNAAIYSSNPNQQQFIENSNLTPQQMQQQTHNIRISTSQWQPNIYSSNVRKSPCQRHSSTSKSPDIRQSFNKQNIMSSPMQGSLGTNESSALKNSYRSKSGDFVKESKIIPNNSNQQQQQDYQQGQQQQNGFNYYIPTSSSAMGMRNEQIASTSPSKSKSQVHFQNLDSLNSSNNVVQMEYLSKVKFLEEAIEYKNKEIERLMVLTAASRRNNPRSPSSSKSPERRQFEVHTINITNEENNDEEQRINQVKLHSLIQDLERRNSELENELFNAKCIIEEKDRDLLKIRQQIEHIQNCTDNQMNFIQLNEDLELRVKEKEINEQNMLVQLEQQNLMIRNMEMDQIKKLEEYKDLIQKIQIQNSQEMQGMQREKNDMQLIINKLENLIQSQYLQSEGSDEKRKRASIKGEQHHYDHDTLREIQEKDDEIHQLNEKINLQTQLIAKQRLAVDTLKREIVDIQGEHENRIKQLVQQNSIYAQEKVKLQEDVRVLSLDREEQIITSQELLAEQQRQLLDMASEREELLRARDEAQQQKRRLNEEREAFESEKNSFKVTRDIYEKDRDQFELERQGLNLERNSLSRDKQIFERDRQEFENEIESFNQERNAVVQQQNHLIELQQILEQKDEKIGYMKQQQAEHKHAYEQLKAQIQAQIKSYEEVINQTQQENQQLIAERESLIQERNEDMRENAEILELKKQLMYEGIAKQEVQQKLSELMKKKEVNEELSRENTELKTTLDLLKQKIRGMQNIDDDIKEYINSMCKEKNNLQDRHVAHLEEIKNLKLQLKGIALENKSLNLSIANLKEEIKLYKNQQTDIMLDEKNKKSFLRVHLQKKLNLLNAQLETYIRTTLDLDEIYYILLFNQSNSSPFSSPQKPSLLQQYAQNQSGQGSSGKQNRKSQDQQSLSQSTPTSQKDNISKNFNQNSELDEKTKQKIEQLNNKRKRDLDKVYQIMEDFISLISNIQQ